MDDFFIGYDRHQTDINRKQKNLTFCFFVLYYIMSTNQQKGFAMLEKIRKFFNAKKQLEQPVQPKVVEDYSINQNNTMLQDEKILRCYVLFSEHVFHSTAIKDPWCIYVHVKPGYQNVEFVQAVYAENKIPLNIHFSRLYRKEEAEAVLYISLKSYMEDLNDTQRQFFERTAPEVKDIKDYRNNQAILDRAYDLSVKMDIERGRINPKTFEGPIRLPYQLPKSNGR